MTDCKKYGHRFICPVAYADKDVARTTMDHVGICDVCGHEERHEQHLIMVRGSKAEPTPYRESGVDNNRGGMVELEQDGQEDRT